LCFVVCSSAIPKAKAAAEARSTETSSESDSNAEPSASGGRTQPVVFLVAKRVPVTARVIKKRLASRPIQR
jgi:hypothetical protein